MLLFAGCKSDESQTSDTSQTTEDLNSNTASDNKGSGELENEINDLKEDLALKAINYTTVTEGFDWGPAITRVILNMGYPVEEVSLSINTFKVTSIREICEVDYQSMKRKDKPTKQALERLVTAAYVSDAEGSVQPNGTYITLEMAVGPDIAAGASFYYDMGTGHNIYVDTDYAIKLVQEAQLMTTEGNKLTMEATTKEGFQGNRNLIVEEFDITGTYKKDDITLRYASYRPKKATSQEGSNPCIVWLHGAGEGGKDPVIALYGNKVVNLATESVQSCFGDTGAYILVPQCETMWMDYDGKGTYNISVKGSNGVSYYTEALMGLIQEYVESNPDIDPNRIYLGGCSNGGYMTMNLITTYPNYFAAAFPTCEAYSNAWLTEEKLEAIKDLPIWFTHAKTDSTVAVFQGNFDMSTMSYKLNLDENEEEIPIEDFTNAAYNRLVAAGAKDIHYSLWDKVVDTTGKYFVTGSKTEPYEYMGHYSWIYVLNNECVDKLNDQKISIFDWMSSKSKNKQ